MTEFQNTATVLDTVTISGLSTTASGAWSAPSTLIDNTPSGPHGKSYLRGTVRLAFSAALTAGSGAPYVTLVLNEARDGTNLANPPGTSATAPSPNARQVIVQLVASAAFQIVDFPWFDTDAVLYGFQVYNGSGVAFSGTATMTLYRGDVEGL